MRNKDRGIAFASYRCPEYAARVCSFLLPASRLFLRILRYLAFKVTRS